MYREHRCHSGEKNHGFGSRGRFGHRFNSFGHERFGFRNVPVNIEETDESFIVHLFAPALIKENLKVSTKDDRLTISYQGEERIEPKYKFNRKEFKNEGFERAFALNGKVLTEQISAAYTDGILKVTLPKNPETNIPEQNVLVD